MRATAVAGLVLALGVSMGCGPDRVIHGHASHPSLSPVADAIVGCPAHLAPATATTGQVGVVPADAGGAQMCGYVDGQPMRGEPVDGVRLDGKEAAMLGYLLNRHTVRQSSRCRQRGIGGLVRFDYPGGRHVDVSWVEARCREDTVFRHGVGYRLDRSLASMLLAISGAYSDGRGGSGSAPQLTGLSAAHARSRARAAGYSADLAGQEITSGLPPDTVVLQSPPAGGRDIGNQIDALLSAHPSPPCTRGALKLSFVGGGLGTGNDFGAIAARDVGHRACALRGPVAVRPLTASDKAIHTARPLRAAPTATPIILSPRSRRLPVGAEPPLGEIAGLVQIVGAYRDGPGRDGLCPHRDEVTPAYWRVTIDGHRIVVANRDHHDDQVNGLAACLGRFQLGGLQLDG